MPKKKKKNLEHLESLVTWVTSHPIPAEAITGTFWILAMGVCVLAIMAASQLENVVVVPLSLLRKLR